MKHIWLLSAIGLAACDGATKDPAANTPPVAVDGQLPGMAPASKTASVVPRPTDQAQLDRMILAGYTPHSDHLHPPGVNECPLNKGSDVVM